MISVGVALYSSMDVYANFQAPMTGSWKIYTGPSGAKLGGHAITTIGYGKEGSTKYWIIQNSWGTGWGKNGYARIKRGTNCVGIEEQGFYLRAWVTGGQETPCIDAKQSGLSTG